MKTIIRSLVTILVLLCFGFLPRVQAVVPPPDGSYPNFTTAEGQNALFSLTTGAANTGVGWFSLESVNTGVGAGTLVLNTGAENTAMGTAGAREQHSCQCQHCRGLSGTSEFYDRPCGA